MKVRDIMTREVFTCGADASASAAARIMWEHDCGCVPVTDSEGRPIGMVTDRDLCMAAFTRNCALDDMTVGSTMARKLFVCSPDDPLTGAEKLMRNYQIRRLPVVDAAGRLVGLVALGDVAQRSIGHERGPQVDVTAVEVAATLAAISKPRPPSPLRGAA